MARDSIGKNSTEKDIASIDDSKIILLLILMGLLTSGLAAILFQSCILFILILFLTLYICVSYISIIKKSKKKPILNIRNSLFIINVYNVYDLLIVLTLIILLIYFVMVYPIMAPNMMNNVVKENEDAGNFAYLSNEIFMNTSDNASKVQAILNWQNKNMLNIYGYYEVQNVQLFNKNILYFPKAVSLAPGILFTIKLPPNNLCLRYVDQANPNWVLISKSGMCKELSLAFEDLSKYGNISYRTIRFSGIDHQFDEAYVNDSWIIVDPSISTLGGYLDGYNVSPNTYEDGWGYKITFAYAQYPNGTLEDVTYKYTTTTNASIYVLDDNGNILNSGIIIIDGSPVIYDINEEGICNLSIKPGKYSVKADNGSYFGSTTIEVKDNTNNTFNLITKKSGSINTDHSLNNTIYPLMLINLFGEILILMVIFLTSLILLLLIKLGVILKRYQNKKEEPIELVIKD